MSPPAPSACNPDVRGTGIRRAVFTSLPGGPDTLGESCWVTHLIQAG